MQPQIIHETEVHRQHVRLKIPIQAEIDGVRYQVDDWSVGGFGVESVIISRQPGERFPARMIFPFEEFEMSMRFEARMVYVDHEHGRFGCAFTSLSREQAAVFRYLVDSYLSGEMVSAGDILQVRARDGSTRTRATPVESLYPEAQTWPAQLRHYGRHGALALAGLALAALVVLGVRERFFVVEATSAVVEGPLVQLRAPLAGRFVGALEAGQPVDPGAVLGTVRALDGTTVPVESPCECVVLEQIGLTGQYYQVGDPLVALVEAEEPLTVRAQLGLDEVEALEIGDRAQILVPGEAEPRYGEITRIGMRPRLEALGARDTVMPVATDLAQVIIRPDLPFELEAFGELVVVRFP